MGALLTQLYADRVDWFILGGGANVCFPDEGLSVVVHTGAMRRMFREENTIRVWPGVTIQQLVRATSELGLSGMESLMGVPGNLGGAIAMNAGTADWGIWELVAEVTLWTPDGLVSKTREDVQPSYRHGNLGEGVLLEALLQFESRNPAQIKIKQESLLRKKSQTQPVTLSSAGCAYKNPPGDSAGRLIDSSGLKGTTVGGMSVSERHANFMVNDGSATAHDFLTLLEKVEATVFQEHGVKLEREIVIVPAR